MSLLQNTQDREVQSALRKLTTFDGLESADLNVDVVGCELAGKTTLLAASLLHVLRQPHPGHVRVSKSVFSQAMRLVKHRETTPTLFENNPPDNADKPSVQENSQGPGWVVLSCGGSTVQVNDLPGQVLRELTSKGLVQWYRANPRRLAIATIHSLRTQSLANCFAMQDSIHLLQKHSNLQFGEAFVRAFRAINHWPVEMLDELNVRGTEDLRQLTDVRLIPREGWTGRGDDPYEFAGINTDGGRRILDTLRRLGQTIEDAERFDLTPVRIAAQEAPERFLLYQSHNDLIRELPSVRARLDLIEETAEWFFGGMDVPQTKRLTGDGVHVTVNVTGDPIYVDRVAQSGPERVLSAIEHHARKSRQQSVWARWLFSSSASL